MNTDTLNEVDVDEDIVITDALGCVLSKTASVLSSLSPGKRLLVATARNFEKHFGSVGVCLSEKLNTPEKDHRRSFSSSGPSYATASKRRRHHQLREGLGSSSDEQEGNTKVLGSIEDIAQEFKKSNRVIIERLDGISDALAAILDTQGVVSPTCGNGDEACASATFPCEGFNLDLTASSTAHQSLRAHFHLRQCCQMILFCHVLLRCQHWTFKPPLLGGQELMPLSQCFT